MQHGAKSAVRHLSCKHSKSYDQVFGNF